MVAKTPFIRFVSLFISCLDLEFRKQPFKTSTPGFFSTRKKFTQDYYRERRRIYEERADASASLHFLPVHITIEPKTIEAIFKLLSIEMLT